MPAWQRITSRRNPKYKEWRGWIAHPETEDCPWVFIEGSSHVAEAAALRPPVMLIAADDRRDAVASESLAGAERFVLPATLYEGLSAVRSSQGFGAFFEKPGWTLEQLTDCVLYADGIQDPGNLGTLIRTASATGIFSIVTAPGSVSCWNAKVVRATAATLFRVPLLPGLPLETLLEQGFTAWIAEAGAGESLFEADFRPPLVLVVGHETAGVRQADADWRRVHIPMHPGADSLNVAVAGSLLLFEVFRRRYVEVPV